MNSNSDDHDGETADEEEDQEEEEELRRRVEDALGPCVRCAKLTANFCDGCEDSKLCSSCEDRHICCVACSDNPATLQRVSDLMFRSFVAIHLPKVHERTQMPASYFDSSNPTSQATMLTIAASLGNQDSSQLSERETNLIRAMNADVAVDRRVIYRLVDAVVSGDVELERAWRDYKIRFAHHY